MRMRARGRVQIRFLRHGPRWLVNLLVTLFSWIFFNRFVLWWVPHRSRRCCFAHRQNRDT